MRALAVAVLALLAGCFNPDGGETIADPGGEVFDPLFAHAPRMMISPPITVDTRSCSFAMYVAPSGGQTFTFVLVHPSRTKCELWLGRNNLSTQYCRFDRDEHLVPVDQTAPNAVMRVTDEDMPCVDLTPP